MSDPAARPPETDRASETDLRSAYARARGQVPASQAIVVLQLGEAQSALAWGTDAEAAQLHTLPLGLQALAERLMPHGRWSELAIEQAIAEVEDTLMPWHGRLPAHAPLFSADAAVAELAWWAGMPGQTGAWRLGTDAVEHLFNRWVARAQGRPASQDELPTSGQFSATLLVLREWLHHLGLEGITVLNTPPPDPHAQVAPAPRRS